MQSLQRNSHEITYIIDFNFNKAKKFEKLDWNFDRLKNFFLKISQCTPSTFYTFDKNNCKLEIGTHYFSKNDFTPQVLGSAFSRLCSKRQYVHGVKISRPADMKIFSEVYGLEPYFRACLKNLSNLLKAYSRSKEWVETITKITDVTETLIKHTSIDPWQLTWNKENICICLESLSDWNEHQQIGYDQVNFKFITVPNHKKRTVIEKAAPLEAARTLVTVMRLLKALSLLENKKEELKDYLSDWEDIKKYEDSLKQFLNKNFQFLDKQKNPDLTKVIWENLSYELNKPNDKHQNDIISELSTVYRVKKKVITKFNFQINVTPGKSVTSSISPSSTKVTTDTDLSKKEEKKDSHPSSSQEVKKKQKEFSKLSFGKVLAGRIGKPQDKFTLRKSQDYFQKAPPKPESPRKNNNAGALIEEVHENFKKRLERRASLKLEKDTDYWKAFEGLLEEKRLNKSKSESDLAKTIMASRVMQEALKTQLEIVESIPTCELEFEDGVVEFNVIGGDPLRNWNIPKEQDTDKKENTDHDISFFQKILYFVSYKKS